MIASISGQSVLDSAVATAELKEKAEGQNGGRDATDGSQVNTP